MHPQYDKAKVVLALDADFLGLDSPTPLPTRQFSKRRRVETEEDLEKLNRLYMVEAQFSITGMNADHRLRMKPSEVKQFATDLAASLGAVAGLNVVGGGDRRAKFLAALVKDLKAAGAEALVVAGSRQPAAVHTIVAAINQSLGSSAVAYTKADAARIRASTGLKALAAEMGFRAGFDAVYFGRQSGVQRARRSAIHGGAFEGRQLRASRRGGRRNSLFGQVARSAGALP